ncbi:MAG: hypothetical protein AB7U82_12210 [Blastocatellales bacterium]
MFTKLKTSLFVRHLIETRFIVPVIIALVAFATLAVNASVRWSSVRKPETTALIAGQGQASQSRFPIVLLNLTRFGFEPAAMRIPAGKCQFAIRNITGLEDIDLQVARKNGERLLIEKYPKGKRHWEKAVQLPVGDYVISVVGNPQWTFNLNVIPPGK